jgi:hypothetical protein
MTLRVARKELPMNDVNVFACIKNHKLMDLMFRTSPMASLGWRAVVVMP